MKIKLPIVYYKWLQGDNRITIDTPEWQEWLTQTKTSITKTTEAHLLAVKEKMEHG